MCRLLKWHLVNHSCSANHACSANCACSALCLVLTPFSPFSAAHSTPPYPSPHFFSIYSIRYMLSQLQHTRWIKKHLRLLYTFAKHWRAWVSEILAKDPQNKHRHVWWRFSRTDHNPMIVENENVIDPEPNFVGASFSSLSRHSSLSYIWHVMFLTIRQNF